jgi:hypothetical protein
MSQFMDMIRLPNFGLGLAKGQFDDVTSVHKFGANFDIDNTSEPETVWTAGGLYPWSSLATAQTLYCLSDSASDTSTLTIQGLDSDYNLLTEIVTLTGTTAVTTTNQFIRVFRMSYNGGASNVGTVTARVTSGSGTIVAQIDEEFSETLMCVYTIPAGYTGYLLCGDASVQKNKDVQIKFFVRQFGQSFKIAHMAEVFERTYRYDFPIPMKLPEKTDLEVRADNVESNNTRLTANFDLILDKD